MTPKKKIAAFDFDGTLSLHNGYISASHVSDYRVFNKHVVPTFQRLHKEGYALVIISNQKSIGKAITGKKATMVKAAMDMIIELIGLPVDACLSLAGDQYRKPDIGMWKYYLSRCVGALRGEGGQSLVDIAECFYVGDAAGRKGDHADSDLKFAENAGLRFMTPEQCFTISSSNPPSPILSTNNTSSSLQIAKNDVMMDEISRAITQASGPTPKVPIMLILIGLVGSGKSTFGSMLLDRCQKKKIWEVVSQDTLGSRSKCEKAVASGLACGKSMVIDRTNLTIEQRGSFVALAKTARRNKVINGCQLHCLIFSTPINICEQRIMNRTNHPTNVQGGQGLKILEKMKQHIELPKSSSSTSTLSSSSSYLERFDVISDIMDLQGLELALKAYSGN